MMREFLVIPNYKNSTTIFFFSLRKTIKSYGPKLINTGWKITSCYLFNQTTVALNASSFNISIKSMPDSHRQNNLFLLFMKFLTLHDPSCLT